MSVSYRSLGISMLKAWADNLKITPMLSQAGVSLDGLIRFYDSRYPPSPGIKYAGAIENIGAAAYQIGSDKARAFFAKMGSDGVTDFFELNRKVNSWMMSALGKTNFEMAVQAVGETASDLAGGFVDIVKWLYIIAIAGALFYFYVLNKKSIDEFIKKATS